MATVLNDYLTKQEQLKKLQEEIQAMEGDERLQKDIEFQNKVEALMAEYGKSKKDVLNLLDPERLQSKNNASGTGTKAKRRMKRYVNPHTKEEVETRGGNHKTIRAWKDEYGSEEVDTWGEFIE